MIIKFQKNITLILFLLFTLNYISKSQNDLDEKYFFQLYPSRDKIKPYLFYMSIHNSRLITINSTEKENCSIIENIKINEYPIKDLSSVFLFNETFLIKTCFGPDKIVEIIDEKNETFINYSKNNLNNTKFCYSTTIYNPYNALFNETIIITYWIEFTINEGKEKYIHKCILFYPRIKKFSDEFILQSNYIGNILYNNFYAKKCITFRFKEIYCYIALDSYLYMNFF